MKFTLLIDDKADRVCWSCYAPLKKGMYMYTLNATNVHVRPINICINCRNEIVKQLKRI